MTRAVFPVIFSIGCLVAFSVVLGQDDADSEKAELDSARYEKYEGYFGFYWDDAESKIWLRIENFEEPFLYVSSLATGLGSNPVGLDRGQLGADRLVRFKKVGQRTFLIQENVKFRASTGNVAEARAIRESFAESILWAGDLKTTKSGETVVDVTSLLMRDAHDCIGQLESTGQGNFSLDLDRSYFHLPRTKAFPRNVEFEVALTFKSTEPGRLATRTAADGKSITLRQHHSFVKLPDPGYEPREWDPRVGAFAISYADYGVPIDQPIEKRLLSRHRLQKQDSSKGASRPVEPIVYYVDPGVPEPVLSALIEGAGWWAEAFEAAGFVDAFRVEVLPEDADPMDVRYNVIQWVHRATRGWSYGQSFTDPRTGEIIKGHVLLGSLRVRQDYMIFEGLVPKNVASCGLGFAPSAEYLSQLDPGASSTEVALARIRQLSAHEVGHTLGFAHNFAASTYGDRASVMDYPAPRTKIVDGKVDLSDAYGVGIGEWDKFAVKYAYSEFPAEELKPGLEALVAESIENKWLYITDADARPAGAAHPLGNLWDNGSEPVAALQHEMQVRAIAMKGFGQHVIADGQPLADLEKSFVPIYLHHRYQVEATAKMLGGFEYTYALKGDGQIPLAPVSGERQAAALEVLLQTLSPAVLAIPDSVLESIPPRVENSATDRERFSNSTSPIFDPTSAIGAAAELTLGCLFQPQRASRLARNDPEENQLTLRTVIRSVAEQCAFAAMDADSDSTIHQEARRVVQRTFVEKLISLAGSNAATHDARAVAFDGLLYCRSLLRNNASGGSLERASSLMLQADIDRFFKSEGPSVKPNAAAELPPGSPIGS